MKFFIKKVLLKTILMFMALALLADIASAGDSVIKIGILAKRGPVRCMEKWSPTARYLNQKISGHPFKIVPLEFEQIASSVQRAQIDFILANPSFYVELENDYGITRIATLKNKVIGKVSTTFGGVVFCKKQRTDIRQYKELKNKSVMALKETSFGGWRSVWREFNAIGINPFKDFASLGFGGTEDAVISAVQTGRADVGILRTDALERFDSEGRIRIQDFHVIHEHGGEDAFYFPFLHSTREYPEWPMAKLSHTSNALSEQVATTLIAMPPDSAPAQAAMIGGWTIPQNYQSVHDCLKELKLGPYKDFGKITAATIFKKYWILICLALSLLVILVVFLFTNILLNRKIRIANNRLEQEINERIQTEKINQTLFAISTAANTAKDIKELYESIHTALGCIMDVSNFFIAILDVKTNALHFPYHAATADEDFTPITNFDTHDSLTGFVFSQGRPVLLKKNQLNDRARQKKVRGPVPLIWMGAPLINKGTVIGVVAVQSYTSETLYRKEDLEILAMASDQMAIAIDRKQTEDELRESEKKYRQLFINAPSGIYEIDYEKLKFVDVNDVMCQYCGYSKEEFLSLDPLDILTKDGQKLYVKRLEKIQEGENLSDSFEYTILRKDGRKLSVILNNEFIYADQKLKGARGIAHDITSLKKAEKEKIMVQKIAGEQEKLALIGQVAGKIAHDFNNLLGVIMGNTELARMDCQDEKINATLDMILKQTRQGKSLTKNLVAFARNQEPRQEFFRISDKIDFVVMLLKKDLTGIDLVVENTPDVPVLLADPGMIEHALMNLIQNSIHAVSMEKNPRIIIRAYGSDKTICFDVEDNGCGISKDHLDDIYEPSFTLKGIYDKTGSYPTSIKGTGYGMANVKKYIELHRGSLSVESEWGKGTKFTIRLPVTKKELTHDEKIEIQGQNALFEKYILLIEDEPAISDIQYRILTQPPCSHRVDVAYTGQEAITLFGKNNYDLISLDYFLPGKTNGMDVYQQIRARHKNLPILFLSGHIEFLKSIKKLEQTDLFLAHLSKPCLNKEYVESINLLLEKAMAPRE